MASRNRSLAGLFALLAIALLSNLTVMSPARAETFDIVSKQVDTPTSTVWRIETPNVKQRQTNYPQIRFVPGDEVSVAAGGCVQTGGSGATWKRYVNPAGPNSDHLYHGLIAIPGVTNGLVRLQTFGLNAQHPVPANSTGGFLSLGYEDDSYGDNGYTSHDNGTGDQCKNSVKAFVIVSIGHAGTQAANASQFIGITPDKFRCQGAWAFHNFDTAELSWSTFKNAFSMSWYDYLDPATYVTFLAARGNLASSGNCAGMSILADVAEDQFLVDDLQENLWQRYKSKDVAAPKIVTDINTAHWQQLSAAFLHSWLVNVVRDPVDSANQAESDLTKQNYNYGMISIAHGSGGHVLVPLRVSRSGDQTFIDVYDSNRPCGSVPDPATYPQIVISKGRWSYLMASGETWTGGAVSDGLAYIPYTGSDSWTKLGTNFSGLVAVIFGADTDVTQVTDGRGRRLFAAADAAPGVRSMEVGAQGLQQSVFRLPMYGQAKPTRPRSGEPKYTLNNEVPVPAAAQPQVASLEAEYAGEYAGSGKIFMVNDAALADLRFEVSGKNAAKPVRAMVHQGDSFFEVRATSTTGAAPHAFLTIHQPSQIVSSGITLASADAKPVSAVFTYGSTSATERAVHVTRTAPMSVTSGARLKVTPQGVAMTTRDAPVAAQLTENVTTATGRQSMATRALMMTREP